MPLGPCEMCGATNYAMSYGGPSICPACDCGRTNPIQQAKYISKLKEQLRTAEAERDRLAYALRVIAADKPRADFEPYDPAKHPFGPSWCEWDNRDDIADAGKDQILHEHSQIAEQALALKPADVPKTDKRLGYLTSQGEWVRCPDCAVIDKGKVILFALWPTVENKIAGKIPIYYLEWPDGNRVELQDFVREAERMRTTLARRENI
jgi:hypothetical protein